MFGPGSSFFGASTNLGGSSGIAGANNGLSVSLIDATKIVLGQNIGQVGNPAVFLNNRELPMAGFQWLWDSAQLEVNTNYTSPFLISGHDGSPSREWFRYLFPGTPPQMPYQEFFETTANGDGTFDLVRLNGFNVDQHFSNVNPSWTTRMEYAYQGSLYEYHLQFEDIHSPQNINRLMSFTYTNHDDNTSTALAFFTFSAMEFRPLFSVTPAFSFQYNPDGSPEMKFASLVGGYETGLLQDVTDASFSITGLGTASDFFFQNFNLMKFGATGPWLSMQAANPGYFVQNFKGNVGDIKVLRTGATIGYYINETDTFSRGGYWYDQNDGAFHLFFNSVGNGFSFKFGVQAVQSFHLSDGTSGNAHFFHDLPMSFGPSDATRASANFPATSAPGAFTNGNMWYDGTDLFFRNGGVTESIFMGTDTASAPATSAGVAITNFYGSSATNFLGDPNKWALVNIGGVNYKIPLYT
jgi:hypothetical protein